MQFPHAGGKAIEQSLMVFPCGHESIDLKDVRPLLLVFVHRPGQAGSEQMMHNILVELGVVLSVVGLKLPEHPQLLQGSVKEHPIGHQRVQANGHCFGSKMPHFVIFLEDGA
jgi:hypothetical protein